MRYRRYRNFELSPIWVLLGLNLLLFIITRVVPGLIGFLELIPATVLSRPWTVLTNLFLHGSFGHILANMLTLYFFGSFLCRLVGERKFLLIYFIGGIVGNIVYILLAPPLSLAIGASGAVYALGGALVIMTPRLKVFVFPIPVPIPLWAAVIGGFLIISPNVAWQAHLGGLVFGLIAGYFLAKRTRPLF